MAAHIYDLRAAAAHGYKTVYVRRPTEDIASEGGTLLRDSVKCKSEGGEVDLVVDSIEELAKIVREAKA